MLNRLSIRLAIINFTLALACAGPRWAIAQGGAMKAPGQSPAVKASRFASLWEVLPKDDQELRGELAGRKFPVVASGTYPQTFGATVVWLSQHASAGQVKAVNQYVRNSPKWGELYFKGQLLVIREPKLAQTPLNGHALVTKAAQPALSGAQGLYSRLLLNLGDLAAAARQGDDWAAAFAKAQAPASVDAPAEAQDFVARVVSVVRSLSGDVALRTGILSDTLESAAYGIADEKKFLWHVDAILTSNPGDWVTLPQASNEFKREVGLLGLGGCDITLDFERYVLRAKFESRKAAEAAKKLLDSEGFFRDYAVQISAPAA